MTVSSRHGHPPGRNIERGQQRQSFHEKMRPPSQVRLDRDLNGGQHQSKPHYTGTFRPEDFFTPQPYNSPSPTMIPPSAAPNFPIQSHKESGPSGPMTNSVNYGSSKDRFASRPNLGISNHYYDDYVPHAPEDLKHIAKGDFAGYDFRERPQGYQSRDYRTYDSPTGSFPDQIVNPPTIRRGERISQASSFHHDSFASNAQPQRAPYPQQRYNSDSRRESRYSSSVEPRHTNAIPETVSRSTVSDAALWKRGLPLTNAKRVIKRGYGVNDPENIAIVNMKDQEGLSWQEIVERINQKRVAEGKTRFLTVTAAANRYSRNCPVLMSSVGKEFYPLSVRKRIDKGEIVAPRLDWTAENDLTLVKIFKEYEAQRWEAIANEFAAATGIDVHPIEAARRYAAIR